MSGDQPTGSSVPTHQFKCLTSCSYIGNINPMSLMSFLNVMSLFAFTSFEWRWIIIQNATVWVGRERSKNPTTVFGFLSHEQAQFSQRLCLPALRNFQGNWLEAQSLYLSLSKSLCCSLTPLMLQSLLKSFCPPEFLLHFLTPLQCSHLSP